MMRSQEQLYIGGKWVAPSGRGNIDVIDAATEEPVGRIPDGNEDDVDRAVKAAAAALGDWAATPPAERARFLDRIKEGLAARAEEIATIISAEVGSPITMAKAVQAALPVTVTGSYARIAREFPFEERIGNSLVVREPVGVVAAITPWNYPLHQAMGKVAPALAAGCTVVLKPSEVAPLSAFILAEVVHEAGLPPGVFNLVTGLGPPFGEMLVRNPGVDMISLTGSTRAGRRVAELAAPSVKRVALELGGKSATVILEDADFDKAVGVSVSNAFLNGGQTCSAWTRMLVPRKRQDQALEIARRTAAKFKPGDPRSAETRLGPLASAQQRERVRKYIRTGIEEGAQLVVGGPDAPEGLPRGYYVKPTIFAEVKPEMTIAREEIFGPVISVLAYEDEDDAVRIANDTIYGLAGGVWSSDASRAERVARRLRTGQVDINGGRFNPLAPFGGFKQSGRGRELGKFGLEEFLEIKSMQF
jgi:acyl-CoA reductase-like NAD-dependent aldehyde dehydrogenase